MILMVLVPGFGLASWMLHLGSLEDSFIAFIVRFDIRLDMTTLQAIGFLRIM